MLKTNRSSVGFTVTGSKKMLDRLASAQKDLDRKTQAAIVREAEEILAVSKRDFVPVDTGVLRASGHVRKVRGEKFKVDIVYGGAAEAYALIQHERLDFHHDVGQAKYLEIPFRRAAPQMGKRLAELLKL